MSRKRTVDELPGSSNLAGAEAEIKKLHEKLKIAEQKVYALSSPQEKYHIKTSKRKMYRCTLSSDWHIGSLYANKGALVEFYRYADSIGIRDHFCAGDMIEGHGMFRGQTFELREVGFDAQLNALAEVADQFPKRAKTYFITGNHDASFAKQIGFDVGSYFESACHNFTCIGRDSGMLTIDTPSGDLRFGLLHPDGGTAYALSYKSQKIIESWEGGQKPHILGIGHFHKAEYMPRYRNVKAIQAGTFENQTPFMARKALAAHVGGWIIEIDRGDLYNRIRTEFVEFF